MSIIRKPDRFGIGNTFDFDLKKIPKIEDIKDSVEGCPICVLTILRCAELTKWPLSEKILFDYKKELEKWWQRVRDEEYEAEMDSLIYG